MSQSWLKAQLRSIPRTELSLAPRAGTADAEAAEAARKAEAELAESILDFMERVSPQLHRPEHFAIYARELEQAVGGERRLVFAGPPQHGKTEVTLHGLAWIIRKYPTKRHAYITYAQGRARRVARRVRRILAEAGIVVGGTLEMMTLPGGGQCLFTSIEGGITGEPVDGVALIDDPFKNRKEADSPTRRATVEDSYRDAIETRVHPSCSIFLLATRWSPKDLSGVLVDEGWKYINLPAIAEAGDPNGREVGEPLFPAMWPLDALIKKRSRVGEFTWQALYQGHPRPRGGSVFHEPAYYSKLPTEGYRGAYGVDLAYTEKTSADWSICLELLRVEPKAELRCRCGVCNEPFFYVRHVDRAQVEAPDFALTLRARHVAHKSWRMLWRASGTEKGAASFIRKKDIPLVVQPPPGDKLVSSTEVAAAWNDGRVLIPDPEFLPHVEEWLYPFLDVVRDFVGNNKEVDDDVDALGNAHAALIGAGPSDGTIRIPSDRR